ncbi:histidine utilization repressor [Pelagibius litoralis]|uniref:Histidine utilization repressor n=1 Tax=Pelagibius litoralis TaxID=374515 RepID=A0A967EXD3_9PROT|nr:histidine utilization repressor [Pelagibius litoralis]NIA68960.1 histidine utilization repressor [Pelagibius litoralis]
MAPSTPAPTAQDDPPLYQQVKDYIVSRILAGDWPEGGRVPSENELTREQGVSRMTVNRALRELTGEGWLDRVQGAGTFVAQTKPQSEILSIHNIADEIRARGHDHSAEICLLRREKARAFEAKLLGLKRGDTLFHSIIVHRENGQPIQLEDRYVSPAAAPAYMDQDFTRITPNHYLMQAAPLSEAEHMVMAVLPSDEERRLLEIDAGTPCLLLRRHTWSGKRPVTWARLLHPGDRYRLGGRFSAEDRDRD